MRFQCDTGYELVGDGHLLCQIDSTWSPPNVPECHIMKCPAIPSITHGNFIPEITVNGESDVYGATLSVQCDRNYLVNGPKKISCGEDGQWTEKPTCQAVACGPYPGLDSDCIQKVRLRVSNTLLFLYCNENGTRVGESSSASCVNNQWSDLTMRCKCHCKVNADTNLVKLENLNANGLLEHGQPLIWSCKQGATKVTTATLTCIDGEVGTPVCRALVHTTSSPSDKPTDKTDKGTTNTNVTERDDEEGGMGALAIIFIAIGAVVVVAAAIIAVVKRKAIAALCQKGKNTDTNAEPPAKKKEDQPLTVQYTDEKPGMGGTDAGRVVVQPEEEEKVPLS